MTLALLLCVVAIVAPSTIRSVCAAQSEKSDCTRNSNGCLSPTELCSVITVSLCGSKNFDFIGSKRIAALFLLVLLQRYEILFLYMNGGNIHGRRCKRVEDGPLHNHSVRGLSACCSNSVD